MTDGDNTQQAHDAQNPNGQCAGCEPHRIHLVEATVGLLAECHKRRRYLMICGELLELSEMAGSDCGGECKDCGGECKREIIYCTECLDYTVKWNAEAGLTLDSGVSR